MGCGKTVVPHEGTWIEISRYSENRASASVVPHEGTWIEMLISRDVAS